jgi:hypothetical protein
LFSTFFGFCVFTAAAIFSDKPRTSIVIAIPTVSAVTTASMINHGRATSGINARQNKLTPAALETRQYVLGRKPDLTL